ncbi:hypothetical protein PFDSM3638_04415 [Pyrococcus furiosus DSM 3638]|uniref:Uncharacterized protein n=2 Tax=Pyrococcus furiosus TaxID=2261 RepID=A0A5C0XRT2_PYRFU|nr:MULTISPECIES: hypothetical protein [Pyrococcus]AFN03673.1 hypothetical protein PFC_03620 [Pyrococcus furiosus COM1]MDK2869786.1 hypothetical protein [Pyrococcus sp.]QEK78554.1 hypothetical protein PFDSM3638_04415 [Pyrococcus furiosus DSM 3638]
MKKYLVLFTFFLLFFSEPLTAIPYWIKEGVYITYVSRPLEPPDPEDILNKHGYGTMTIVYNRSGQLFLITTYGNGQVNFTISSISSNLTKVKIKISGEYVVVRYYYPSNSTPNFTPFWNEDDVIAMESGPLMFSKGYSVMKVALWNLTLWGEYYIDTNTGDVYDLSGKYYGKTILWNDPNNPMKINETICFDFEGKPIKVANVTISNLSVLTYYRVFKPPAIMIKTTSGIEKVPPDLKTVGRNMMTYDGSSGILLSMLGFHVPDAKAAGFPVLYGFDEKMYELSKRSKDDKLMIAGGLVLYDTNANFLQLKRIPYSPPTTPLAYLYIISGLFVIIFILIKLAREGRS